ncbi:MAG: Flp family type IVb pilin [Pirellulales bacterium]
MKPCLGRDDGIVKTNSVKTLTRVRRCGATAAEYALVISAVVLVAMGSISMMSQALNSALDATATQFEPGNPDPLARAIPRAKERVPQAGETAKPQEFVATPTYGPVAP